MYAGETSQQDSIHKEFLNPLELSRILKRRNASAQWLKISLLLCCSCVRDTYSKPDSHSHTELPTGIFSPVLQIALSVTWI